jgi:hypothetical protein
MERRERDGSDRWSVSDLVRPFIEPEAQYL